MAPEIGRALKSFWNFCLEVFPAARWPFWLVTAGLSLTSLFLKETAQDATLLILAAFWLIFNWRAKRRFEAGLGLTFLFLVLAFLAEGFNFPLAKNLGVLAFLFLFLSIVFKLRQLCNEDD